MLLSKLRSGNDPILHQPSRKSESANLARRALEGSAGRAGRYVAAITLDAGVDALLQAFWIDPAPKSGRLQAGPGYWEGGQSSFRTRRAARSTCSIRVQVVRMNAMRLHCHSDPNAAL